MSNSHISVPCNDRRFPSCKFKPHTGNVESRQIRSKLHEGTIGTDLILGSVDLSFEYLKQIQCTSSVNRFHKCRCNSDNTDQEFAVIFCSWFEQLVEKNRP